MYLEKSSKTLFETSFFRVRYEMKQKTKQKAKYLKAYLQIPSESVFRKIF